MQSHDLHFGFIEEQVARHPLVVFHDFHKHRTSPSTAYLKGSILFVDGSTLSIFQHIRFKDAETLITDYRYHYMNSKKQMIFRYDNASHHAEIDTHPHHKHIKNEICSSEMPEFRDVMDEAATFVVDQIA